MDLTNQKTLRDGICFFSVAIVLFFAVYGITLIAQSSWQNGLRKQVDTVLSNIYPDKYSVGEFVKINSPFGVSAAVYKLGESGQSTDSSSLDVNNSLGGSFLGKYGIIMRLTGMYGPQPVVFIYDSISKTGIYCGLAAQDNIPMEKCDYDVPATSVQYWIKRLPEITGLENTVVGNEQEHIQ